MAQRKAREERAEAPWWLTSGASCEFCFQDYSLTIEYYCDHCDRPICPLCVTFAGGERLVTCPRCGETTSTAEH